MPKREKRERARREPRPPKSDDAPEWFQWFGGARSVRIPIGFLFVAAAMALALSFAGYVIGFSRAQNNLADERRNEAVRNIDSRVNDPLIADLPINQSLLAGNQVAAMNQRPVETATPQQPDGGASTNAAPPTVGDPRVIGLNYFIVAREHPQEAQRVAGYLRENGVEALVVDDRSRPWQLVIAQRGFEPGMLSSEEATAFRAHLHTLGRTWKRDHRGTTDFSDTYARKFQG